MTWKALLFLILTAGLGSCSSNEKFTLEKINKGEIGKTLWIDSVNNVKLQTRYEDIGFSGYKTWLSLERRIPGDGLIQYKLLNKKLGSSFYEVINGKLYLFDEEPFNQVSGWVRIDPQESVLGADKSLDSITTNSLQKGLYKLENKTLKKISDDPNEFRRLFKKQEKETYYITPPGIGIIYSYDLKELAKRLASVKGIEEAPSSL